LIFLYKKRKFRVEELIGRPVIEAIRWIVRKISRQGFEIKDSVFVKYPLKPHERTGQIRPEKELGDESFLHLKPVDILSSMIEEQILSSTQDNQVLGITSTIFIAPKRPGTDLISHLFLLDLIRPPTLENIEGLKRQVLERLGLSSGIIVASSGSGMHFYGDRLFSLSDWIALYGKSLLMNHSEEDERWVDERHIGHTLIPFPYYPNDDPIHPQPLEISLFSTLRISSVNRGRPEPSIVAVLG
jgi:hypothetical protein